jgi:hypothetical protein
MANRKLYKKVTFCGSSPKTDSSAKLNHSLVLLLSTATFSSNKVERSSCSLTLDTSAIE